MATLYSEEFQSPEGSAFQSTHYFLYHADTGQFTEMNGAAWVALHRHKYARQEWFLDL